ncbi:SUN domain-containing protein 1 isoform X6 [Choloepus didactylus]|uniref:SUN domain-containing protein 1 isoform X6 n=1 Tax=Choloepus didactylus TaxID=27675 RepID=UPI00189FE1E4|nr:SUN domain-containing protein 1 isoform X6 [Choloepus didactylus]
MDFSRLHLYTPPQCVPENTGYTYALSSSYSSDALDFETEHKLDPVFDSPRMSRRSLRLVSATYSTVDSQPADAHTCAQSTVATKDKASRTAKQRRSASKPAFNINHVSRKVTSSVLGQNSCHRLQAGSYLRPPVLDESLICEQTKVDHFWGLDDDSDLKGGGRTVAQGNGERAPGGAEAAARNGYTCDACSLLSERRAVLTAQSPHHGPSSRVYSRDRAQKRGASFSTARILSLARCSASSFSSFLVHLFQVVLMKLNYEPENYKLKSFESKDCESKSYESKSYESKAHAGLGWRRDGRVTLGEDGHLHVSREPRWKVASAVFWWLGTGWYQLVTLISWLNVFLLTRCLRNICKFLFLLIPLALLLGAGLSMWGQGSIFSLLPVFNWTLMSRTQTADVPKDTLRPEASHLSRPLEGGGGDSPWPPMSEVERQGASLSGRCHSPEEKFRDLAASLQSLQARVDQMGDASGAVLPLVRTVLRQHLQETGADRLPCSKTDFMTFHQEHESRIANLEDILGKLTEKSEIIQEELEQTKLRTTSGIADQELLTMVKHLQLELGHLKSEMSSWQNLKTNCEKVDTIHEKVEARVRDTVRLLLADDGQQGGALEWLLQKFSSQFVSKDDLHSLLRDLELRILRNITHHVSVTKQMPTSETVASAVSEAGVSGITEAEALVLVNNALKLYSQDKTGMVDFALESGGGSILSTRCSETYETKTALISLFGIPLWYFSQSPRVVIQPDIYPGNCWAFKGSQGYLVVRLSMTVYPTTFTLEHIPKTLSPTGNITSAPKDFAVYGLENEYQEEGLLLGQFTYDQDGESLQMFPAPERPEKAFQIVELRIFSNWGHPEYTCLYRFRVHGEPVK